MRHCRKLDPTVGALQFGDLDKGLPSAVARDRHPPGSNIPVERGSRPADRLSGLRHPEPGWCITLSVADHMRHPDLSHEHEAGAASGGNAPILAAAFIECKSAPSAPRRGGVWGRLRVPGWYRDRAESVLSPPLRWPG